MQKRKILLITVGLFIFSSTAQAGDCPGQWQVLPHHYRGKGAPCRVLGLDSHQGVCQSGRVYETLCDDTTGDRFKTCQGPRVCNTHGEPLPSPVPYFDCSTWDFEASAPCPPGTVNSDCKSGCQSLVQNNNCTSWDYKYNQPCPPGFVNRDCHGSCEPM